MKNIHILKIDDHGWVNITTADGVPIVYLRDSLKMEQIEGSGGKYYRVTVDLCCEYEKGGKK